LVAAVVEVVAGARVHGHVLVVARERRPRQVPRQLLRQARTERDRPLPRHRLRRVDDLPERQEHQACDLPVVPRAGVARPAALFSAPTTRWSASDEFRPNPPVPTTPVVDYVLASRNADPGTGW